MQTSLTNKNNILQAKGKGTRMHSSRMRTPAHWPGGVPAWWVYLPGGCTCPGGVPARGCTCPGGLPAQGVYLLRGECTCPGGVPAWGVPAQVLPRCGQTDTCKNITFANLRTVIISKYIKDYKQSRTSDKWSFLIAKFRPCRRSELYNIYWFVWEMSTQIEVCLPLVSMLKF